MRGGWLHVLALALPLCGLGATWAVTHHRAQQGVVWEVPIAGYDPRDLLRGHYVVYRYEWPGLDPAIGADGQPFLCLTGKAPVIERTSPQFGFDGPGVPDRATCSHPVMPDANSTLGSGRLYVAQDRASALEAQLRAPGLQGMVRIRVREDGLITPMDIVFRPRPPETDGAPSAAAPRIQTAPTASARR